MQPFTFLAPAKVNLGLRIVGRRSDGYHRLWSVMTFFPLYDQLTFQCVEEEITLTCAPMVTGTPQENLVWRAAHSLQQASGTAFGVRMGLQKQIPHGAGLGGGSSDAALALLVLNQLWQLHWPRQRLIDLAVRLGADIPFFLGEGAALAQGIGEQLTPLPVLPQLPMLLIYPGCSLATAAVFRHWHAGRDQDQPYADPPLTVALDRERLLTTLHNDLQETALALQPMLSEVVSHLPPVHAMSGSGTAFFGIFPDVAAAAEAAERVRAQHPDWQIFHGVTFNQHPFSSAWESAIKGAVLNGWAVAKR
ncbi:MAG: 4-(cytidine 5'-diphospho)-2-C-methyl-D-erythritol kinase [Magnetococcales bacterium]|nr:4-(cytidine 5'-diphospho)-2-C-methyl-D-erythritol kinase [Magnetococcales bacterium]